MGIGRGKAVLFLLFRYGRFDGFYATLDHEDEDWLDEDQRQELQALVPSNLRALKKTIRHFKLTHFVRVMYTLYLLITLKLP